MSDVRTAESLIDADDPPPGRSLWRDALVRLRRNRAAMVSLALLTLISLICFLGPTFSPHDPQTVYRNYVKVAPSLEARPTADEVEETMASALRRARVDILDFTVEGDLARVTVRNTREGPLDERITRYVDRPADFSGARIVEMLEDGRVATIEAEVSRIRFLMGTDANGRDLMTRIFLGGQISILIGLLAAFVAVVIGVLYGATAGYVGGRVDDAMMRVVDILYSLPFIF
ncbi:MAG: ABC transporter permease, partial [Pseudomonadota bacterium]